MSQKQSQKKYEFAVRTLITRYGKRLLIRRNEQKLWLSRDEVQKILDEILRNWKFAISIDLLGE